MRNSRPIVLLCLFFWMGCDSTTPMVDDDPKPPTPYTLVVPARFPEMEIPVHNPMTVEGVALGRRLFFDPILSADGSKSCASCHLQQTAFSDSNRVSEGVGGARGVRQAMPLMNIGYVNDLFWDGRAESLEAQALQPVENDLELAEDWDHVVAKLQAHPTYPAAFEAAFGTRTLADTLVVKALAQFERTLLSGNAKFDRVNRGEDAFTEAEQRGFDLFFTEKADCFHCHGTLLFTDNRFHNNGLDVAPADSGRAGVSGQAFEVGLFRSPSLRNIAHTAPYMHDGRFETLEEVIRHYNFGVQRSPTLDPLMQNGRFLFLTDANVQDLIAFLHTLSDPEFLANPAFADPS